MKTKVLGNSDPAIAPIGFGAWAIGGDGKFGWGAQDDTQSIAAIHRALELGVNGINAADVFRLGHSEVVVARATRSRWTASLAQWISGLHRGKLRQWSANKSSPANFKKGRCNLKPPGTEIAGNPNVGSPC